MNLLSPRSFVLLFALGLPSAMPLAAQTDAPPPPAQTDVPPAPPEGGPRHGGPAHRLEMLQRDLGLTNDQTTQVRTIFEAERAKLDALRSNTSVSQEDRHTQMTAIHQDESARIKALLTPEQVTRYDAMEARMRQHRPGNGEGPPPPPPPAGQDPGAL